MTELDKLFLEYQKKFGEGLPTFMMPNDDLNNLEEIIKKCLETGKPYELDEETQELLKNGVVF